MGTKEIIEYNETLVPKRCKDKAYIVLLGLSGAGKSSTMNALFDRDLLDDENTGTQSMFTSQTQEVLEYKILVPKTELLSSKEMIVVDTPGFFDVNEENHKVKDARTMATLESYLASHEDLKNTYPSAVLLVVDFKDNRIYEPKSYFVEFLKAIETLNSNQDLIDTDHNTCNFILVLTHFMDAKPHKETTVHSQSSLQTNPEPRIRFLTALIKTFTSISSNFPVVFAENKGRAFKLVEEKGYFRLPNGDKYPYNLFKAMENVAIACKDVTFQAILSSAFSDPLALRKQQANSVPLVGKAHPSYTNFSYILNEIRLEVKENNMTLRIDHIWKQLGAIYTQGNEIFLYVLKATFVRNNIASDEDLPETPKDVISLLRQLPNNIAIEKVVRKIGIVPPPLWDCSKAVGSFYNITMQSLSQLSPFSKSSEHITIAGLEAPLYMQVEIVSAKVSRGLTVISRYPTLDAYDTKFWEKRGVWIDPEVDRDLSNTLLDGHNLDSVNCNEINGIKEFRHYSVFLVAKCSLDPGFLEAVRKLPEYSRRSKDAWGDFFRKYGSHVLQSAYLGGYVKVIGRKNDQESQPVDISFAYQTIENILAKVGKSEDFSEHERIKGWSFEIKYFGGDSNVSKPPLSRLFTPKGVEKFKIWHDSLQMNPILLISEQRFQHISHFMQGHRQLGSVLSAAANAIVGCAEYKDANEAVSRSEVSSRKCTIL